METEDNIFLLLRHKHFICDYPAHPQATSNFKNKARSAGTGVVRNLHSRIFGLEGATSSVERQQYEGSCISGGNSES